MSTRKFDISTFAETNDQEGATDDDLAQERSERVRDMKTAVSTGVSLAALPSSVMFLFHSLEAVSIESKPPLLYRNLLLHHFTDF
jgi:hypothetical protein